MSFYSTLYNIHIANNFLLSIISYTYGYLRSNSLINGKFLNQFTLQGGNHMTAISKPVNKQKKIAIKKPAKKKFFLILI